MFEKYVHTKEDLEAIEEALAYLERPELDFIFKDRNLIKNTLVISFDSKELFIWTKLKTSKLEEMPCQIKGYNAYKINHRLKFTDKDQVGWRAGVRPEEISKYLPKEFSKIDSEIPKISGSLLTPFVGIHKKQREINFRPLDPYYTKDSHLATIIHEFGHVYYNNHKLWYYSENKETANYMKLALNLYNRGEDFKTPRDKILRLPTSKHLTEVFAFCTDYQAAKLFWPKHKKDIDTESISVLEKAIKAEERLDLDNQDSFLTQGPHNLAKVIGKILLERNPNDWPQLLLNFGKI